MRIRKLELKDAPFMFEWMHDKSVVQDLKTDFESKTLSDCEAFISDAQSEKENLHLAIVDDDDEYMGTVSLKHINESTAEFGITVRHMAMGKGFAKDGMNSIIQIGAERGITNIYWCVDPRNSRALRFYDKNGFSRVLPSELNIHGGGYSPEEISRFIWYRI